MNCISNLAKKNLKAYKTRNILTVLSIILSTCLITAICISGYSIQQMAVDMAIETSGGNYHAIYRAVNEKQLDILKNNRKIEKVGENINFERIKFSNPSCPEILLSYFDSNAAGMSNIEIKSGKFPSKNKDIALESWVLRAMKINPKIGQTVRTKYGDFTLSAILSDNPQNKKIKTFSIGLVSKSFVMKNMKNPEVDCHLRINKNGNAADTIFSIASEIGIDNKKVNVNTQYIKAMGLDFGVIMPIVIVGIVVVVAAVMVIYNIFYISTVERVRDFGLLRAVGATKKQIKKIILKEGILLSLIGIPIGILLGHAMSFCITPLFSIEKLKIKSSVYIVIIASVVSLITIFISLRKPKKFAAKISPIEAIGYNPTEISSNKKERNSLKKVSVFNMSYLNLWRNKKRTIITIISLAMSGVLFIVVCSILLSMNINNIFKQDLKYEFKLTSYDDESLNDKLIQNIRNIDGVRNTNTDKMNLAVSIKNVNCSLYGYDDTILDSLKNKIEYGKLSIEALKNKNKIILVYDDKKTKCPYKVGDKIKLNITKFNNSHDKCKNVSKEFIISGVVNENFSGATKGFVGIKYSFIVHEDEFNKLLNQKEYNEVFVSINENKFEEVRNSIKKITDNNKIQYSSIKEERDEAENQFKGIEVASLSLVGIIALIGILNLINTTITSIFSRKKEFGTLEAIGLSNSQLITMLQLEGIYYAGISIVITMILGTSLGYLCFRLFKKAGANYADYKFPIIPLLLFSLALMGIEILLAFVIQKLLRKESIVDRIRFSE